MGFHVLPKRTDVIAYAVSHYTYMHILSLFPTGIYILWHRVPQPLKKTNPPPKKPTLFSVIQRKCADLLENIIQ